MAGRVIDQRFTAILRRHLPYLVPAEVLPADAPLRELGLDSMAAVGLVLDLENELGVTFTESTLREETFASAADLWSAVGKTMRT